MKTVLGCLFTILAITGCGLLDGDSSKNQSLITDDPAACSDLDEQHCLARSDCEAQYVEWGCACPACAPGADCPPCDCDGNTGRDFAGCTDRDPCQGLDEQTCAATEGCTAYYGPDPCPAIACYEGDDGTIDCPQCDDTVRYQGCYSEPIVTDPCDGLSEEQCVSTPECEPIYGGGTDPGEPTDPTDPNAPSDPTDPGAPWPSEYQGCRSRPICGGVACDLWCEWGFAIDENGCEICECLPPPSACYALDEDACLATPECEAEYFTPCVQVCTESSGGIECRNCTPDGVCHPIDEDCDCAPIFVGCHDAGCGDR